MRVRTGLPARLLQVSALIALALLIGSCSGHDPQDTLAPHGHIAAVTKGLFYPIFWIAVAVFFFVEGLLLFIILRFRDRGNRELPVQLHGNTRLEITWTVIPTLLLASLTVPTIATLIHVDSIPNNAMTINVIAHQWWWEFQYPDQNLTTGDQMHIPVGKPIHIHMTSIDVVHSFWVPSLAGKTEVIPNHPNDMWLDSNTTGTFDGQCAEFCGIEHALMRFEVIAQSQSDFDAWVQGEQAGAQALNSPGAQVFLNGPCTACHTINGTAAKGNVGPNLTHFGSRTWFEEMDNNPDNVAKWLRDPQAVKEGNLMPNYHLSEQDIQSLVGFLELLK